jgi:hypothetical protein
MKSCRPSWGRTFNTCKIMPSYANSWAFGHQRNPSCGGSKPDGSPKGMSPSNWDPKDSLRPSSTWLKTEKESSKEAVLLQLCWSIYVDLERELQPEKGRFHCSSGMDQIVLAPIGVLAHENSRGYWKHSWILCQDCRGHPSRSLYLLCLDLCLPQCIQSSASINMPQI